MVMGGGTTTLSAFLADVDGKTTAWQNRAARQQQARAPPAQNRTPNPNSSAQSSTLIPLRKQPAITNIRIALRYH